METKVFVFDLDDGTLVERPSTGSGPVIPLDEYRSAGWEPIHWDRVSEPGGSARARYYIVMENRGEAGGTGEFERNLRALRESGVT